MSRTNFCEILIKIQNASFRKMHIKISSVKWCPFCLVKYIKEVNFGWQLTLICNNPLSFGCLYWHIFKNKTVSSTVCTLNKNAAVTPMCIDSLCMFVCFVQFLPNLLRRKCAMAHLVEKKMIAKCCIYLLDDNRCECFNSTRNPDDTLHLLVAFCVMMPACGISGNYII